MQATQPRSVWSISGHASPASIVSNVEGRRKERVGYFARIKAYFLLKSPDICVRAGKLMRWQARSPYAALQLLCYFSPFCFPLLRTSLRSRKSKAGVGRTRAAKAAGCKPRDPKRARACSVAVSISRLSTTAMCTHFLSHTATHHSELLLCCSAMIDTAIASCLESCSEETSKVTQRNSPKKEHARQPVRVSADTFRGNIVSVPAGIQKKQRDRNLC